MKTFNFKFSADLEKIANNSLKYDAAIIGSGIAAYILCRKLHKDKKILVLEQGSYKSKEFENSDLINHGNFKLKQNTINRTIGGTSTLWSGNICEYESIEFKTKEGKFWQIKNEIQNHYLEARRLLGLILRKNYNNIEVDNFFKKRRILTQFIPTRVRQKLTKLRIHLLYNAKVILIGENKHPYVIIGNKKLYFKKIILANGCLESIKLIDNSVKKTSLILNMDTSFIGSGYMNHPKIRINKFVIPKKNNKIFNIYENRKFHFNGIALNNLQQYKNRLNNTYFRLHPRFFAENKIEFKILNFLFSNKKIILQNIFKLNFDPIFSKKLKKYFKFNLFLKFFNFRFYYYILFFCGLVRLKVKYFDIEYFMEMKSRNKNKIYFQNDIINTNINLISKDFETLEYLHEKLVFYLDNDNKINPRYKKVNFKNLKFEDAAHHIGGLVMNNFTKNGFVNQNLQIRNTKNIFVCSSSLFPSSGSCNPSLTIASMCIKLSNFILNN